MNTSQESVLGAMPEWNLNDLYPGMNSSELKQDLEKSERLANEFESKYQGNLLTIAKAPEELLAAVHQFEYIQDFIGKIGSYAFLRYAGDSSCPDNVKFFGDMQEKLTATSSHLLFFALELNRIPDEIVDTALQHEGLSRYKPWFTDLRKEKPYQLDDDIEKLFSEKAVTGRRAWNRLFTETIGSMRFSVDGKALSLEPTLNMLMDNDGSVRQKAAEALSETFKSRISTFTLVTNTLAKDKEISDRWRSFEDVADSRHLDNNIEREVVEALVKTVRGKYADISHRYYAMKTKWLGVDQLNHWDRNAPLFSDVKQLYTWDQAKDIVLNAYEDFSPEIAAIARQFFDKNWIDGPDREGKRAGAFAHPVVPSAHPYIMLNYMGSPRDVMVMAHELGHGIHQCLSNEQGFLLANTPLTLAETASVFGEMLTFKSLLSQTTDPIKKKALIASKVEDMINTVIRQIAFYSFERDIHQSRRKGELTSQQIAELWTKIQVESLGPSVKLNEGYENFWCYIPHFVNSPFYVYAYAFGECLVNSLYAKYEQSDAGFQEKYIDMLKAGGSKNHIELLAPFDLNASDPDFWFMGLKVIEDLIDQLEQM